MNRKRSMKNFRVVLAAVMLSLLPDAAISAPLEGSWRGTGYVKPTDGERRQVECEVRFVPQGSKAVAVSATCRSNSTTIHQTGQLSVVTSERYIGDFYNSEYDISGRIRVIVKGSSSIVTFSGPRGSGNLNLRKR